MQGAGLEASFQSYVPENQKSLPTLPNHETDLESVRFLSHDSRIFRMYVGHTFQLFCETAKTKNLHFKKKGKRERIPNRLQGKQL